MTSTSAEPCEDDFKNYSDCRRQLNKEPSSAASHELSATIPQHGQQLRSSIAECSSSSSSAAAAAAAEAIAAAAENDLPPAASADSNQVLAFATPAGAGDDSVMLLVAQDDGTCMHHIFQDDDSHKHLHAAETEQQQPQQLQHFAQHSHYAHRNGQMRQQQNMPHVYSVDGGSHYVHELYKQQQNSIQLQQCQYYQLQPMLGGPQHNMSHFHTQPVHHDTMQSFVALHSSQQPLVDPVLTSRSESTQAVTTRNDGDDNKDGGAVGAPVDTGATTAGGGTTTIAHILAAHEQEQQQHQHNESTSKQYQMIPAQSSSLYYQHHSTADHLSYCPPPGASAASGYEQHAVLNDNGEVVMMITQQQPSAQVSLTANMVDTKSFAESAEMQPGASLSPDVIGDKSSTKRKNRTAASRKQQFQATDAPNCFYPAPGLSAFSLPPLHPTQHPNLVTAVLPLSLLAKTEEVAGLPALTYDMYANYAAVAATAAAAAAAAVAGPSSAGDAGGLMLLTDDDDEEEEDFLNDEELILRDLYGDDDSNRSLDSGSGKSKVERFSENSIFDYFNLDGEVGKNRVEATCKLCARTVKATVGVTSNFLTHLRTHHKDMFQQYEQHRSEVTKKRGRPLKSLHQIKQRFSFAMRKRRREIIFSAFSEFETEDVPNDTSRICATCKLCGVTIRGMKTVSSNFYSHLKRKHSSEFNHLNHQAERELGKFPTPAPSISPSLLLATQHHAAVMAAAHAAAAAAAAAGHHHQHHHHTGNGMLMHNHHVPYQHAYRHHPYMTPHHQQHQQQQQLMYASAVQQQRQQPQMKLEVPFDFHQPQQQQMHYYQQQQQQYSSINPYPSNEAATQQQLNSMMTIATNREADEAAAAAPPFAQSASPLHDEMELLKTNESISPNLASLSSTLATPVHSSACAVTYSTLADDAGTCSNNSAEKLYYCSQQSTTTELDCTLSSQHHNDMCASTSSSSSMQNPRLYLKNFNTILISADVGGTCTDLVMTKISACDFSMLLPPTRSLVEFLTNTIKPRTEADGFVLYSFEADCMKIVDELRKMGFNVLNMSYLPPNNSSTVNNNLSLTVARNGSNDDDTSVDQLFCTEQTDGSKLPTDHCRRKPTKRGQHASSAGSTSREDRLATSSKPKEREKIVWLLAASMPSSSSNTLMPMMHHR